MKANKNNDLHFYELFITLQGRISRQTFIVGTVFVIAAFLCANILLSYTSVHTMAASFYVFLPFAWALLALAVKRCHDINYSGYWLIVLLLPVIGPLFLLGQLSFRKGNAALNRFGLRFEDIETDYFKNPDVENRLVNDVTLQNPITVKQSLKPATVEELINFIKTTHEPICIGGGRFSMGGQTASAEATFIDMRDLNQVTHFSLPNKTVTVQAGARWCDIQRFIEPFDLSIKIMQTYSNFTVGGSLSVNVHGRYIGLGPLILSVNSVTILLLDGIVKTVSPTTDSELFYATIGGYGAISIILEAELSLADNIRLERSKQRLSVSEYLKFFKDNVRQSQSIVLHNADIYPPHYNKLLAISWQATARPATTATRTQTVKRVYPIFRYLFWLVSSIPFAKYFREYVIDSLFYSKKVVHWRNYEAGYDVAELEPESKRKYTYFLQEYFVPIDRLDDFMSDMREVLKRYQVNMINVSIRHAFADPGSLLAWARTEVFAFVIYYKRKNTPEDANKTAIWTRELINRVLRVNGSYYLPYQIQASERAFHQAYPRAKELFALKQQYDPTYRLRNQLWDTYYKPQIDRQAKTTSANAEFHAVLNHSDWHDKLYLFLQNIFHLYPEDKFFILIKELSRGFDNDNETYNAIQQQIKSIKPLLSELTYAVPALRTQKAEMLKQTRQLLGMRNQFDGYVEMGSTGRYFSVLKKHMSFTGKQYFIHESPPSNSPPDLLDRGQFKFEGQYLPLNDYAAITPEQIPDNSIELFTCYIGLHHITLDRLDAFIASIVRVLKPGGVFILRDHDCRTE